MVFEMLRQVVVKRLKKSLRHRITRAIGASGLGRLVEQLE